MRDMQTLVLSLTRPIKARDRTMPARFPASADKPGKRELFGHPRALSFLFATEMWERFSYYGMRALLVLYMVEYLLPPSAPARCSGLALSRARSNSCSGRSTCSPSPRRSMGFTLALVYLTPIFGGLLADRVLGQRRTVILGASLMAVGHFMMAFEPLFLLALIVLIFGNGAFKPNISTQVGMLYASGDRRRDRAFSIFYVGINLGAFLAPLVCGTLGEEIGWHYGFAAAGVGMTDRPGRLSLRHAAPAAETHSLAARIRRRAACAQRLAGDRGNSSC